MTRRWGTTVHVLRVDRDLHGCARYRLTCPRPGAADDCEGWEQCYDEACSPADLERLEELGEEPIWHGVEHYRGDGWMVPTYTCWAVEHPDLAEAVREAGVADDPRYDRFGLIAAGEYRLQVGIEYEGWVSQTLTLRFAPET